MTGEEFIKHNSKHYYFIDNGEGLQLVCILPDNSEVTIKTFAYKDFVYPNCSPEHLIDGLLQDMKNADNPEAIHNIANVIAQIKQDAKTA